jgi:hypothetical protein
MTLSKSPASSNSTRSAGPSFSPDAFSPQVKTLLHDPLSAPQFRISSPISSDAGLFTIVCVADRVTKAAVELGAVQDDLLRMHRIDGAQWDREVTGILDVDYKLGPAAWRSESSPLA